MSTQKSQVQFGVLEARYYRNKAIKKKLFAIGIIVFAFVMVFGCYFLWMGGLEAVRNLF